MRRKLYRVCKYFLLIYIFYFPQIIIFNGCNEEKEEIFISSVFPTNEQLDNSRFVKFLDSLKILPENQRKVLLDDFLIHFPQSPVIEGNELALFYFYGSASSVFINGDIQNGWAEPDSMEAVSIGNENFFYYIYSLPPDARVDYEFIVDNQTITDPRNPVVTPSGFTPHSQCAMPLFKPDTIRNFRYASAHGTVDSFFFKSNLTSIPPRMIKVYKPTGYDSLSGIPSLYVNDGFKAINFNNYINILDNLIADRKIPPIAAVFIDFIEGDQDYFLNKPEEYTTVICNEIVTHIDKEYKTSTLPAKRAIAGISAGGNISLFTCLRRPDVFLKAAGQSTTLSSGLLDAIENADLKKDYRFYLDVGRFDLVNGSFNNQPFLFSNQMLQKELNKYKIQHTLQIVNDGHQWASWRERTDDLLVYLFN